MRSVAVKWMSPRLGRLFLSTGLVLAAVTAASAQSAPKGAEPDLRGIWRVERYEPVIRTLAGALPPMKPAAKALYDRRVAARKAGKTDDPAALCQPAGNPRIMYQDRPFMIVQTPLKVTIVHEYQHVLRHIYLNEKLDLTDKDPLWEGYSAGRWDGGTLVVETAGFNDKTWLDEAGLPHSEKLKVVERIRRVDAATLEDQITVEDPDAYTAPWTTRLRFKYQPNGELKPHICTEKLFPMPANARPRG